MLGSIADFFYQELERAQFIEFLISDFWVLPQMLKFVLVPSISSFEPAPICMDFFDKIIVQPFVKLLRNAIMFV